MGDSGGNSRQTLEPGTHIKGYNRLWAPVQSSPDRCRILINYNMTHWLVSRVKWGTWSCWIFSLAGSIFAPRTNFDKGASHSSLQSMCPAVNILSFSICFVTVFLPKDILPVNLWYISELLLSRSFLKSEEFRVIFRWVTRFGTPRCVLSLAPNSAFAPFTCFHKISVFKATKE